MRSLNVWSAAMLSCLGLCGSAYAQIDQQYFVPFPDQQYRQVMLDLEQGGGALGSDANPVVTVVSVAAVQNGTIIYYDHWEDGFEPDILNPVQATTQVYGNMDPLDGIPPLYGTDAINAGSILALRNNVPANPRNPAQILFDGGDLIASSQPVAVTRAGWEDDLGPVIGGAMEVLKVRDYGTAYEVPLGTNVLAEEMFEYVALDVMAASDGTVVTFDIDADGIMDSTNLLNQGQAMLFTNVVSGARLEASMPVQAHLAVGDIYPEGSLESRVFTLFPFDDWSSSYYSPLGSSSQFGDRTDVWLYNPQTIGVAISIDTSASNEVVSVAGGATYRYLMPIGGAAHFYTTNDAPFYAVATVNSGLSNGSGGAQDNDTYDWGFTLVPENQLTSALLVGWGPGSSDLTQNGSPVFVTAVSNTTLYVDFDADPATGALTDPNGNRHDVNLAVNALQFVKFFDTVNNDNDQTGTRIYTLDNVLITGAWGEDPDTAGTGRPYLDMGTTVLPIPTVNVRKESSAVTDLNGNGEIDGGDTFAYFITVTNQGLASVQDLNVMDTLAPEVTYVHGSTTLDGLPVPDDPTPPAASAFPLDEDGFILSEVVGRSGRVLRFEVFLNSPIPPGLDTVPNAVEVTGGGNTVTSSNITTFGTDLCPCYTIPDGADQLVRVDKASGFELVVGATGVSDIEAVAFQPRTGSLFAVDGGQFGQLNLSTGAFAPIGGGIGTGNGVDGAVGFSEIQGLAFDPVSGVLYAVHRRSGASVPDVLLIIDPGTGSFVPGLFGGDDYLVIPAVGGLYDIDDIAVDPTDGLMYAIANSGGASGDRLILVDPSTGATTDVGLLGAGDMEGLGFDAAGRLYGTTGTVGSEINSLFDVDKISGQASNRKLLLGSDYEAIDCLTGANLGIYKIENKDPVFAGEELVYTVVATNSGYWDAPAVEVTDQLPPEVSFVGADASQGVFVESGGVVTWSVGLLPVGAAETLTITNAIASSQAAVGQICNVGLIADVSGVCDPRSVDNTVLECAAIEVAADLAVTKSATPDPAIAGLPITYDIVVTNRGPSDATGVILTESLPLGVQILSSTASQGLFDTNSLEWAVADLLAGESATLEIIVQVEPGAE